MKTKASKNYILFWASQTVSELGSAMTGFALPIWAYQQSGAAMTASLAAFFTYLPYVTVSLIAGAFVDRHSKKSILLWADCLAAVCTALLAVLLATNSLRLWHLYVLNALSGAMNAFQAPAASVAVGLLLPKEKLSKASGLNSFTSSLLMMAAPMLAASLMAAGGLGLVLLTDGLTFLFALAVLTCFVRIPENVGNMTQEKRQPFSGCREGMAFLKKHRCILRLIVGMTVMNFFSRLTYENILTPMLLARTMGNEQTVGFVSMVLGLGGIAGGALAACMPAPKRPFRMVCLATALSFGCGDLLMGLGRSSAVWALAGLGASLPIPFVNAGQQVILYREIPTAMQGRVFAMRNAMQYAAIPAGILLGGYLADWVFEPFMQTNQPLALSLQGLVGQGAGSGMAVMFLCTGVLGSLFCLCWRLLGRELS